MDDYIRNQLDKLIFEEDITQEELAEKVGVSRQTVYKWESGKSKPSTSNILKICEIFNKPVSYFIKGEQNNQTFNNEEIPVVNNKINDSSLIIDKKVEKNSEINNKIDFRTNNKNNDNSVSKKENNDLLKNKILKLVKIFILSLILLILLFYLIASIYKFIKLSNLISKLDKYKNLDNYYCHYINYSNGECILDEEIWYYNNIYKIKCNFDRNNKDNVSLTKYINLNENQISSYDINGNLLSEYNILDEKFYKNGSYMYYLFLKDEKNSEKILKSAFNIGKLEIINNSDKEKIQIKYLNVEAMLDNEYFPEMIIYEKNKTKFIGFYYLKVNCVKEEDINII